MENTAPSLSLKPFKDFDGEYIKALAVKDGWAYEERVEHPAEDSSLYNNPHTSTVELHKLSKDIEGYRCEFYTAEYIPMATAEFVQTISEMDPTSHAATTRFQVQVFSIQLPYGIEPLYIESRTNATLNNFLGLSSQSFKEGESVKLEGDFNRYFKVYTPKDTELNAFLILAPNTMLRLLQSTGDFDVEFSGNKVFFYQILASYTPTKIMLSKQKYDALYQFGVESAKAFVRASRPAKTTRNDNKMWQLFGLSSAKTVFSILLIFAVFIFLVACVMIPLLWPILILITIGCLIRYSLFVSKKEKLVRDWADKVDTLQVVAVSKN